EFFCPALKRWAIFELNDHARCGCTAGTRAMRMQLPNQSATFATYPRVVEVASAMPQSIDSILDAAEQQQASDVFLQEDEVPRLKVNEQIIVLGDEPLSLAHITALWQTCGANIQGDMDRDSGFISRTHTRY